MTTYKMISTAIKLQRRFDVFRLKRQYNSVRFYTVLTSVDPSTTLLACRCPILFQPYSSTTPCKSQSSQSSAASSTSRNLKNKLNKEAEEIIQNAVKRRDHIQNVLEKNKELLREKKDGLVKDIRDTKTKVKEKMEVVIERENVMTIPNLLCVGRAALAPYLGYVIIQGDYTLAMGLLVAAGISDLLDGWIARGWPSQASKMGSFLDPMADKLLVGSLCICLSYTHLLPVWLTVMVLFRDVFLIGAGFVIRYISLPPPKTFSRYFDVTHATAQLAPTFISKVNTAIQLVTVATSLGAPIWNYIDHPALQALWYLTGVTTAAAAISYLTVKDTYKILKKK